MSNPLSGILKTVGSVVSTGYDAEKEKLRLRRELQTVRQLETMIQTEGWQNLQEWVQGRIKTYDHEIISLSRNMHKNLHEIIAKIALRTAMSDILAAVATSIEEKDRITEKIQQLEEITGYGTGA